MKRAMKGITFHESFDSLGAEKREEVQALIAEYLDSLSIQTMGAPSEVKMEKIVLFLDVAGVTVKYTTNVKADL